MKKIILFIQILVFSCAFVACSSVEDNVIDGEDEALKAVNINFKTAGSMEAYLDGRNLNGVESLTLTGEMNVLDFIALKALPELKTLDLTNVKIVEYTGTTPHDDTERTYPANSIASHYIFETTEGEVVPHHPLLESVKLPGNLEVIDGGTFIFCKKLKSIVIPETVREIGNQAFAGCVSLESAVLPQNLTGELVGTFYNCTSLKSVNIPGRITSISVAFYGCENLLSVDVSDNLKLDYCSQSFCNSGIAEFRIPKAMIDIPPQILAASKNLKSVIFHDGVKNIHDGAFEDCPNMKSFYLAAPLESLNSTALAAGPQLEEIHLKNMIPPRVEFDNAPEWDAVNMYKSSYENCTLYVPKGAKAAFEASEAHLWKLFKEIVEE